MEVLLSSHLLDGTLGRSLAVMAVALFAGGLLWQHHFQTYMASHTIYRIAFWMGITGTLLCLNSTFFQFSETMEDDLQWHYVLPLLLETRYGLAWLAFGVFLSIALAFSQRKSGLMAGILGLVVCLSLNSHAAENGLFTFPFVLHIFHLLFILAWLGGLTFIVLGRFTRLWPADHAALMQFSAFILPVFLLALVTGGLRFAAGWLAYGGVDAAYLAMIGVKISLITLVCLCALSLRRALRAGTFNGKRYDDNVGMEFFFALLLLLAAAMLTQLPPL